MRNLPQQLHIPNHEGDNVSLPFNFLSKRSYVGHPKLGRHTRKIQRVFSCHTAVKEVRGSPLKGQSTAQV